MTKKLIWKHHWTTGKTNSPSSPHSQGSLQRQGRRSSHQTPGRPQGTWRRRGFFLRTKYSLVYSVRTKYSLVFSVRTKYSLVFSLRTKYSTPHHHWFIKLNVPTAVGSQGEHLRTIHMMWAQFHTTWVGKTFFELVIWYLALISVEKS